MSSGPCRSCVPRSSPVRPSSISPTPNAAPRSGAGSGPGCASTAPSRPVRSRCSLSRSCRGCCRHRRGVMTCRSTSRRRCIGIITSKSPRRCIRCPVNLIGAPRRGPRRPQPGAHLRPRSAGQGASPPATGRSFHRPRRSAVGQDRVRDARPRPAATDGCQPRRGDRCLRHRVVGHPAAVDEDAPGLRPARASSRSGVPPVSRLPVGGRWRPKRSTSG